MVLMRGTQQQIMGQIAAKCPKACDVLDTIGGLGGQMMPYQYAALYMLAQPFDGGRILEIGCYKGKSALVMCLAAPHAHITTMSPSSSEAHTTMRTLRERRAQVLVTRSVDYLAAYDGPAFDMIYVDGDHKRVVADLPWFNWLRVGGLMLFHDYAPEGARVPCPPVYVGVNLLAQALGRPLDVLIVDDGQVGMAGMYRGAGETWES